MSGDCRPTVDRRFNEIGIFILTQNRGRCTLKNTLMIINCNCRSQCQCHSDRSDYMESTLRLKVPWVPESFVASRYQRVEKTPALKNSENKKILWHSGHFKSGIFWFICLRTVFFSDYDKYSLTGTDECTYIQLFQQNRRHVEVSTLTVWQATTNANFRKDVRDYLGFSENNVMCPYLSCFFERLHTFLSNFLSPNNKCFLIFSLRGRRGHWLFRKLAIFRQEIIYLKNYYGFQ